MIITFLKLLIMAQSGYGAYVFGIQDPQGSFNATKRYGPTAEYLGKTIGIDIQVVGFSNDIDLQSSVANGSVDFVLGGPTLTACLQSQFNTVPVATLNGTVSNISSTLLAGDILTPLNNTEIKSVDDLRGRTIYAGQFTYVASMQSQWAYLVNKGFDLFTDAENVVICNDNLQIIKQIASGMLEVAFANSADVAFLETKGLIPFGSVRVLEPKTHNDFPFVTTTDLFPGSQISVVNQGIITNTSQMSLLLAALSSIPSNVSYAGSYSIFGAPYNILEILALQQSINVLTFPFTSCKTLTDITELIQCPAGYHRQYHACEKTGFACPSSCTCICRPCAKNNEEIGDVSVKSFLIIIIVTIGIVICITAWSFRIHMIFPKKLTPKYLQTHKRNQVQNILSTKERSVLRIDEQSRSPTTYRGEEALLLPIIGHATWGPRFIGFVDRSICAERLVVRRSKLEGNGLMKCLGICGTRPHPVQLFKDGHNGTLKSLLVNPTCQLEIEMILCYIHRIASAISLLHSESPPIVGTQFRCSDVMIGPDGNLQLIADLTHNSLSDTDIVTDIWLAPEISSRRDNSFKSDIFTLGMVMYEILTRHEPFTMSCDPLFADRRLDVEKMRDTSVLNRDQHRPVQFEEYDHTDCLSAVWSILKRCWDVDIDKRPSVQEVVSELEMVMTKVSPADQHVVWDPLVAERKDESIYLAVGETEWGNDNKRTHVGVVCIRLVSDGMSRLTSKSASESRSQDVQWLLNNCEQNNIILLPHDYEHPDFIDLVFVGIAMDKDFSYNTLRFVKSFNSYLHDKSMSVRDVNEYVCGIDCGWMSNVDLRLPTKRMSLMCSDSISISRCLTYFDLIRLDSSRMRLLVNVTAIFGDVVTKTKSFYASSFVLRRLPGRLLCRGVVDTTAFRLDL